MANLIQLIQRCLSKTTTMTKIGGITLLLISGSTARAATSCTELTDQLTRLSATQGRELRTSSSGPIFKQLYDECDTTDRFAERALPTHKGRQLRCSTDKNRVDFIRQYPDGTVVFRSKMSVDADGAPVSAGPHASSTDQPITWLTFDKGSQRHYVNAEDVPFVVVPSQVPNSSVSFQKRAGIRKGDLAIVFAKGRCSFGIVGDSGPYFRLGEASLRTHEDLGNPQCAVPLQYPCRRLLRGGSGVGIAAGVTFIIFPGTRPSPLLSQTVVPVVDQAARGRAAAFMQRYSSR